MILDTNALSAFVDGEPDVGAILGLQHRAAIPVIVLGEFRYGIMGSRHRKTYEEWMENHLRHFDLLAITTETTVPYASLRAALKRSGRPIPANGSQPLRCNTGYQYSVETSTSMRCRGVRRISW